ELLQQLLEGPPIGEPGPELRLLVQAARPRCFRPRALARDLLLEIVHGVGRSLLGRRLAELAARVEPEGQDLPGGRILLLGGRHPMPGTVDGHRDRRDAEALLCAPVAFLDLRKTEPRGARVQDSYGFAADDLRDVPPPARVLAADGDGDGSACV